MVTFLDQWSPINIEGKKQYDREFLMKLQQDPLSMTKPDNLPNMDIIKDKAIAKISSGIPGSDKFTPNFTPSFVKPTISNRVISLLLHSYTGVHRYYTYIKY